jgi:hypothetical protein
VNLTDLVVFGCAIVAGCVGLLFVGFGLLG